jgi:cation:H+ antiporter
MDALLAVVLVLGGLLLLAGGGEALVRSATTLAEIAGVSPAVIGLTVVAIGTSLPEFAVSLLAAKTGQPDLAVGNVVGSNIFNVAAALGLTALIVPLPVHGNAVRLEWPVMFVTSCLCLLLSRDGQIDRLDALFFVVSLIFFIAYTVRIARRDVAPVEVKELQLQVEDRDIDASRRQTAPPRIAVPLVALAIGIIALVVGGRFLVDGSVALARIVGMSERVIGLTIVAGGTGAPELATSLVAAYRKRPDVAVANMLGSNIVNILGILGLTALIQPIPVSRPIIASDMWWMIATAGVLLPIMRSGHRVGRGEGAVLLATYVVYVARLIAA